MSTTKTIAAVGVSEETTAFLRLLLRKISAKSETKWTWGNENVADLVIIDPNSLIGEAARINAESSGVHYAVIIEADQVADDPLVLRHPLDAEQLAKVAAVAAMPRQTSAGITHVDENFYEQQAPAAVEPAMQQSRTDAFAERMQQAKAALLGVGAADSLEVIIKREKEQLAQPDFRQFKLDDATVDGIGVASAGASNRRAENKAVDRTGGLQAGIGDARDGALSTNSPLIGGPNERDEGELPFYFDATILGGPSQIQMPQAPALTLDPKNEVFHADASLSALEPYCRGKLQRSAWKKLTTSDLNQARTTAPSRPYWHLNWLYALTQSNGRLASHFDPGGTYRLKEQVFIEPGYRSHGVIAMVMDHPLRLNEISAMAKVRMEAVFDLVNAYDAVGRIEWTPRPRMNTQPTIDEKQKGLLHKLRWPFGKN
ncbi:MAG TPA: hypothetical protein PLQ74_10655 [Pseudomonadota bacterium]|nr:hypothetical protein [Rhodanobacteraceae bacterium]MBP9155945.1 hypothetical protein [Xanthomonadales bacterium]HQW82314.1 hypothetical protein [Pseudomonadota bacterium]